MDAFRGDVWQATLPTPTPIEDDIMYIATLSDGSPVLVGTTIRPLSGEELTGPFAGLPRYTPDPSSYWHQWLLAGSTEYAQRLGMA
jgi:hypothetical protein